MIKHATKNKEFERHHDLKKTHVHSVYHKETHTTTHDHTRTMPSVTIYQMNGRKDTIRLRKGSISHADAERISDGHIKYAKTNRRNLSCKSANLTWVDEAPRWRSRDQGERAGQRPFRPRSKQSCCCCSWGRRRRQQTQPPAAITANRSAASPGTGQSWANLLRRLRVEPFAAVAYVLCACL